MPIFKLLISAALITMLVGCELMPTRSAAEARSDSMYKLAEENYKKVIMCAQEVEKNHADATAYLVDNIKVTEKDEFFKFYTKNKYELLASTRLFEESDKAPLIEYLNASASCGSQYADATARVEGRLGLVIKERKAETDQIYVDFMMKKINVGELNKKRNELIVKFEGKWNKVWQQINRELENSHYKEVDRNLEAYKADQQVAAARAANPKTSNWGDVYTDLIKQNKTTNTNTTTNCQVYGNTVNCQSY